MPLAIIRCSGDPRGDPALPSQARDDAWVFGRRKGGSEHAQAPRKAGATAADDLRPLLYGDVPSSIWVPAGSESKGEPWASFARAQTLASSGDIAGAQEIWRGIATTKDIESRQALQAWHFLRSSGGTAPDGVAAEVLGAVAEVPMDGGHDVLAAYADGSIRYLNHSGKVAVIEPAAPAELGATASEWLAVASQLARVIGPWNDPLPAVPAGHSRVLMLTPSGPRFGQGPYQALTQDKAAGAFLTAAGRVLQVLVRIAT